MFDDPFSHFLSYGAADQQTARELRGTYDGLLIPATVAAFQREGTGGFVLSLSATEARTPYVIDPRFPLFQQRLSAPKKSHESLAEILGLPKPYSPIPKTYTDALVRLVAKNWAQFNCNYQSAAGAKFEKYAKRLGGLGLKLEQSSTPVRVLAPYFVASSSADPWWKVSARLFAATSAAVAEISPGKPCTRVVATDSVHALAALIDDLEGESQAIIWVSAFNEQRAPVADLVEYATTVRGATAKGKSLFVLYGGFFAVLLASVGLRGLSHGIGYGEHRDWIELPQSGPPPSRYYLPELHCYARAELADVLWGARVTRCACPVCDENPPALLDYHELMMHSVHCRSREIKGWAGLSLKDAAERLTGEKATFMSRLRRADIAAVPFKQEAERLAIHVQTWVDALGRV